MSGTHSVKNKNFVAYIHTNTPHPKPKPKPPHPQSKNFFKKAKVKGLENTTPPPALARPPARPPANKRECEKIHD